MLSVTGVYVFTNMAYFSVLTPDQLVATDAVALVTASTRTGSVSARQLFRSTFVLSVAEVTLQTPVILRFWISIFWNMRSKTSVY